MSSLAWETLNPLWLLIEGLWMPSKCIIIVQVMEVDAFSSVHDMIHAAIDSYGVQATLRQVVTISILDATQKSVLLGALILIYHIRH